MHKPLQHFLAVDRRKCKCLLASKALKIENFGQREKDYERGKVFKRYCGKY